MTQLVDFSLPFPSVFPSRDAAERACTDVASGVLVDEDGVILAEVQDGVVTAA